jgi:hypothetical protein
MLPWILASNFKHTWDARWTHLAHLSASSCETQRLTLVMTQAWGFSPSGTLGGCVRKWPTSYVVRLVGP